MARVPNDRGALALAGAGILAGAALGLALLLEGFRMRTTAAALADRMRATWPARLTRWADAVAAACVATVPQDFPGGLDAWANLAGAILDRESNGSFGDGYSPRGEWNGTGDGGAAHTPWQLDSHYHARHLARTDRTPETDSRYALGEVLAPAWRRFHNIAAAVAAYNASPSRVADVVALVRGAGLEPTADDVDPLTTGKDYASDVLGRAEQLT